MNNDVKIITTYDNQRVQLVFNESFLCLEKNSIIDIELGENLKNWTFRMVFEDVAGETPYKTKWSFETEGFSIVGRFYKWDGPSWVELKKPIVINDTTDPSFKLYIKIRNEMNETQNDFQNIHLSIWKAI